MGEMGSGKWGQNRFRSSTGKSAKSSLTPIPCEECNDEATSPRGLLPDAKIPEDHVEQIFHVNSAGDAAEAAQCQAKIFGAEFG